MVMTGQRAQAVTLEAVAAGLILLSSVVFALQMTAVTPLSASTSSQHIETQLATSAEGALAASVEDGSLERAMLYYNGSSQSFVGATGPDGEYRGSPPENTSFGQRLAWAFDDRGIAYNVDLVYRAGNGTSRQPLFHRGAPSDNAVTASTTVVITDTDPLYRSDENGDGDADPRSLTVAEAASDDDLYMDDVASTSGLFNVVRVEVVAWRI